MFNVNRIFCKSIKIDPLPDIEESIYYTLHSLNFYLQIGFPENSPLYGNIIIYQLQLRLENNEIWVSNLGAQTQQPEQELLPPIILSPPFVQVPPTRTWLRSLKFNLQKLRRLTKIKVTIIIGKDHIIRKLEI